MKSLINRIVLISAVVVLVLVGIATALVIQYRENLLMAADEWIELRILPGNTPPP